MPFKKKFMVFLPLAIAIFIGAFLVKHFLFPEKESSPLSDWMVAAIVGIVLGAFAADKIEREECKEHEENEENEEKEENDEQSVEKIE